MTANANGHLYYGDNLEILQTFPKESVDLVYLDPPFNSKADYNMLFKTPDGKGSASQIHAFTDTWHWGQAAEENYATVLGSGHQTAGVMYGLVQALGNNDMTAYLVMMAARLLKMHRILKQTGSIYLHCDPTASHYLKVVLDAIFGAENFKNEIIWKRSSGHPLSIKKFDAITDTILFYQKSNEFVFRPVLIPQPDEMVNRNYKYEDKHGRYSHGDLTGGKAGGPSAYLPFQGTYPPKGRGWAPPTRTKIPKWAADQLPGNYEGMNQLEKCEVLNSIGLIYWSPSRKPYLKRYLPATPVRNATSLWDDISPISSQSKERLGYQTQKPVALLERIIESSTNDGDVVLDPFCGCGTAIEAAQKLNRKWMGIDVTHLAIGLIEQRMKDAFDMTVDVMGSPVDMEGARDLARRNKLQFEQWAVMRIPHMRPNEKQVGDRGVDGRGYFKTPDGYGKAIISVKGGINTNPAMVRDLGGTMDAEGADIGVLITLDKPTRGMIEAAASYGMTKVGEFDSYHKVQIWTIKEHFEGVPPKLPQMAGLAKVPKAKRIAGSQATLSV